MRILMGLFMKLELVSSELAVKLKGKGFNVPCIYFHKYSSKVTSLVDEIDVITNRGCENSNLRRKDASAPEIDLVIKWLREVYGILIEPTITKHGYKDYYVNIYTKDKLIFVLDNDVRKTFHKYEQAQVAGIEEALKLI